MTRIRIKTIFDILRPNVPKLSQKIPKRFLIFKSWQIWKGCLDLGQCMPSLLKAWTCPPEPKHFYASIINKKGCLWWWRPFKTIKCKWATEVASSRSLAGISGNSLCQVSSLYSKLLQNALWSRNFQKVKLMHDFVEIWSFYRHSDFTWNHISANSNGPKMLFLAISEVLNLIFNKFHQLSSPKFIKIQSSASLKLS